MKTDSTIITYISQASLTVQRRMIEYLLKAIGIYQQHASKILRKILQNMKCMYSSIVKTKWVPTETENEKLGINKVNSKTIQWVHDTCCRKRLLIVNQNEMNLPYLYNYVKSREEGKDQKLIQTRPRKPYCKVTKHKKTQQQESQEASPFHKAAKNSIIKIKM